MPKVGPYIYPNTEAGKAKAAAKAETLGVVPAAPKEEAPKAKKPKKGRADDIAL